MGRKTIPIHKIEDCSLRLFSYVQRKRGLLKKAIELSILCEHDIFLAMYDARAKKLIQYNSSPDFTTKIVDFLNSPKQMAKLARYEQYCNDDLKILENKNLTEKQFKYLPTKHNLNKKGFL